MKNDLPMATVETLEQAWANYGPLRVSVWPASPPVNKTYLAVRNLGKNGSIAQ